MKRLSSFIISAIVFLSVALPSLAAADDGRGGNSGNVENAVVNQTLCAKRGDFSVLCQNLDIAKLIVGLINLIFILSVVVALLYLIWGGFKWLTSGGDKTAVQGAREHIVAAIVGLVVIFLSYFILNFIVGFFIPGFQLNQFKLPTLNNPSPID